MAKENNNKSFVLRIDAATMEALEGWAADEFRSINGQLQWIIADALRRSGRLKSPVPPDSGPAIRRVFHRIMMRKLRRVTRLAVGQTMLRECGRMSRLPVVRAMPFLQNPRFRPGAIIPMICKLIL